MQEIIKKMQDRIMQHQKENGFETIFDFLNEDLDEMQQQLKNCNLQNVTNSYCGEHGESNMKAEIKEIMHAAGDKFDFIRLCNEAQEELDEAAFDLDQESRMNGV